MCMEMEKEGKGKNMGDLYSIYSTLKSCTTIVDMQSKTVSSIYAYGCTRTILSYAVVAIYDADMMDRERERACYHAM